MAIKETQYTVTASRHEHTLFAGLRSEWLTIDEDGIKASVATGAGLGSKYLTLSLDVDGTKIHEVVDITELVQSWVNSIVREVRSD